MKRTFLFILFPFLFFKLFSVDFSISPYIQLNNGIFEEQLFSSDDSYMVSLLEWQNKNIFTPGLTAQIRAGNFISSLDCKISIPKKSGNMYDSDWESDGTKSIYSITENKLIKGYNFSVSAGYQFSVSKNIKITPLISGEYNYTSFEGRNGIGWYGTSEYSQTGATVSWDNPVATKYRVSGIDYLRHSIYCFTGVEFDFLLEPLKFNFSFLISPFSYFYAVDYHRDDRNQNRDYYLKERQFSYFNRFKTDLAIEYKLTENIYLNNRYSLLFGPSVKGKLSLKSQDSPWLAVNQNSGSQITAFSILLGTTFKF